MAKPGPTPTSRPQTSRPRTAARVGAVQALFQAEQGGENPETVIDPVLRALLRAAGAEFIMHDGPPVAVVINEYMDVAHGFFHGEEPKMANGLMDRMAHSLRPREFEVRQ